MLKSASFLAAVVVACLNVPRTLEGQGTQPAPAAGPRLQMSTSVIDVGRVDPKDSKRTVEVSLKNVGTEPLTIRKVRTSCRCVRAELAPGPIAKGAERTIRLQMDLPTADEAVDESLLIYSNDSSHPARRIRITGSIGTGIRLLPMQAFPVGPVYRGALARARFTGIQLLAVDRAPLGEVRVSASHSAIHPQVRKLEDHWYEVFITIDESIPLGRLDGWVRAETEHPTERVVTVPVVGIVEGDLDHGGRRIDFGFLPEGKAGVITFRLPNRGTKDINIVRAEPHLPVPAEVDVTREDKVFKIVVRVAPQPAFTLFNGFLELHTDEPSEPVTRVEVSGGVLASRPFETGAGPDNARFMTLIEKVLERGQRIPADRFFSDVLGGVKDERAVRILLRALDTAGVAARMRAVELLHTFKTPEVLDRLRVAITDDEEGFVRRLALGAYAEALGKAAVPDLLMALVDDDAWVREDAAIYLGKSGDPRAIPALQEAAADPNPETQAAVQEALAALQSIKK
jgi:hypothetical protein